MKTTKIILDSLKNSVRNISKHKRIFSVLLVTQLLFIIILSFIFFKYSIPFLEQAKAFSEPLNESAEPSDINAMYQESLTKYGELNQMVSYILILFWLFYLAYLLINWVNWDIANITAGGKCRCFHYFFMYMLLFLIFTLPEMILLTILMEMPLGIGFGGAVAIVVVGILALTIALYFMYISFSLINDYKFSELNKLLRQAYNIGMSRFWLLLPTYIIMLIAAAVPIVLIGFTFQDSNFLLVLLWIILLAFGLNWGRVYFLTTMEEIK